MELNATLFLQAAIFLSLLIWLSQSLFTPIIRLFDEREQRIEGAKKIALELSLLADEKAKIFAIEFEQAKKDARLLLAEQKHAMDREYAEAMGRVKDQARAKLLAAEAELSQQEKLIREDLYRKTDAIAHDMVSAMMRPSI